MTTPLLRRTTEVFDVETGHWHLLKAQLPAGRSSLAAANVHDHTVLAIGGATGAAAMPQATAEVHALSLRRWHGAH
ncbi:hypothetical protein Ade02nite_57630 [Paractinoplanes deccanensis]|uniref:Uncharacterized protein n=1 Tax=Paractinoplanes deccanensis TaxID=113561 RepID=A0ABQ3YAT9_9ACTN|nr:hypothetical protein [Actinoplanes deccanensis]GID77122.1 hypothetical protein Ade02nite_57630 [Actinoplanes deccanensis]